MAKVGEVMVTSFQTESLHNVLEAASGMTMPGETEYLVVTAENEQPVSLLPADQVAVLSLAEKPARFSVVPVVSEDADLDETVQALTPQLLELPDLAGAVVLLNGEIRGVLPRSVIARQAGDLLTNRGLSGHPQAPRPVYACPNGDYSVKLVRYDPYDPPRCPYDGKTLVRKA